jgi:tartrate-resistant acid phosphatase type 5
MIMLYALTQVKDGVKIHHITIDTELVYVASLLEEQLIWLNETLENAEPSDWTIVAAHFPIRSCGHYAPGVFLAKVAFLPILEHYGVDFYLNGHEHNLQHIIKNDTTPPEFVISGAGGKSISGFGIKPLRCIEMHNQGYTLDFFGQRFGFTTFVAEKESITITFYSHAGEEDDLQELYSFTTVKDADYWSDV